jgi:hypothetical protein
VVLTLIVPVAPKSYLVMLDVIDPGHFGHLLLCVTTPCRERKPITRLVSFLLTSESVQLMSCSLGEAYLKVS